VVLMRVLMITPSFFPIRGGAESVVGNLAVRLNDLGIDTDIMTFNMSQKWKPRWQSKREKYCDVDIYKIPGLNWFPMKHSDRITLGINLIPGRFRNHLEEYDLLHFHVGDMSFPLFSFAIGKPKILHFHGDLEIYRKNLLRRLMVRNTANLCIAISHKMKGDLEALGVQENKIRFLPNAVDTAVFRSSENKERNLLLFVGRITSAKGLHILLNSLQNIETKVHLVVIGPPDWDNNYFHEIGKRISRINATGFHKVTYLGSLDAKAIAKWCQRATVFVLPSFREASGVSILEALSSELPVVATDISGIREAVIHGKNGFLVPTGNSSKLASYVQYLLDNETVRTNFGRKGRETVIEKFSFDVVMEGLCQIYKEMMMK
jgi:glycosyltransferase involved in cell wall biosynthesis